MATREPSAYNETDRLSNVESAIVGGKALKERQYDIVTKANPMMDDYHTGVRSVSDILTYEEAISDFGGIDDVAPDFRASDVRKALESGKVKVYSSYEIEDGVFVTPSKMEAESYSGGKPVYSKEVSLRDVAWLDEIQGQYAKGNTKQRRNS